MKADTIRDKFLDFFRSEAHKIEPPDSLVPSGDPTVLFTPAGMNQFKKEFLSPRPRLKRAATCQRCLRTDDLDKVGKTAGHHTFFEMLGNFSFGDYFKKEAIVWAWEFLTEGLKIPEAKLWISVYRDDSESYNIWSETIKIPASKIIKLGDKENFWPSEARLKGPNGPCGPCSEIFFDQGRTVGCGRPGCNPSCDCDRFVEVWNLVFTQFDRKKRGVLEPLPKKNIDTGMGLERLAAVMQGVHTNFETDLFKPIVKEIIQTLKKYNPKQKGLIFAIADHIRAISFAIYDGVLPSNEARGYVVRKLIRKSILHLRQLQKNKPFLYKLVPVLSETTGEFYPELISRRENIAEVILAEEKSFINTLDSSDAILSKLAVSTAGPASEIAFIAYDTHGIPPEISWNYLINHSIKISEQEKKDFNRMLEEQVSRSKQQSTMGGGVFDIKDLSIDVKQTKFLGYKDNQARSKILKIIKDNQGVKELKKPDQAEIILDQTVFYPESGGQVGDTGVLIKGKNIFEVLDTKQLNKVIVHIGRVKEGKFKESEVLLSKVNVSHRINIARNHTATHLLQTALRQVLGPHVQQQCSLVAQGKLRFDFTHFKNIDKAELHRIEETVNSYILNNYKVVPKKMSLTEARKAGALAFFGEKYQERVRVISMGDISKELCGGTHLDSTGQIGIFKITQESSVAQGIRRIEAVTGSNAYKIIREQEGILDSVSCALVVPQDKIIQELKKRLQRLKELEKQLTKHKLDAVDIDKYIAHAENIKNMKVITCDIKDADMDILRKTVDRIKQRSPANSVIVAGTTNANQVLLVVSNTADLINKVDSSRLIKEIASEIGGSGGGREDFAQAGGNKPENLQKAFQKLKDILVSLSIK